MKYRSKVFMGVLVAQLAAAASASAAEVAKVTIEKFAYTPSTLSVHVGDTVEWTNNDGVDHTVTLDKAHEVIIKAHSSNKMVLATAGEFPYLCSYHPVMKASITVLAAK